MKFLNSDYKKIKAENKRLKAKNEKLKEDIYNLIKRENEVEGMTTQIKWTITFNTEDMIMFGNIK